MKRWGALIILYFLLSAIISCSSSNGNNSTQNDSGGGSDEPSENIEVKFISFGDWGTGDSNQLAVASQIQTTCQSNTCDFGLLLGDNFYNTGVSSTADPQWESKYQDVYGSLNLTFHALLGNHDWDSPANYQAEIDYSSLDSSWNMPAAYYTEIFPSSENPLLQIFVINSNDFRTNSDEQNWLSTQVDQSTATWKIIAFHHPIYSNSASHPPDEKDIYPELQPIICNKVDLMVSGHDHLFSHLRNSTENCGYDQLIIGTGGKGLYATTADGGDASILYSESSFGFGYFSLNSTEMNFQFIKTDGQSSYSYQWQK